MATRKSKPPVSSRDPREKLNPAERKKMKPPPVAREDFERVIRALIKSPATKKA